MRQRVEDGLLTWVKWQEGNREVTAIVEAETIEGSNVIAFRQTDRKSILIGLGNILEARVIEDQLADADDEDSDEEAELAEDDEEARPW
jgi:hypothetical protein